MPKIYTASALVLATLLFSPMTRAQDEKPRSPVSTMPVLDGWGRPIVPPAKDRKPGPAPKHDISGIWDPPSETGIQPLGANEMRDDGNPEHQPPYTAAGLEALKLTKPSNGFRSVLPTETNDPVFSCNPQGMPREDLYELRTTQILQTPQAVYLLYTYGRIWRVIWTDGREVPKDPEPKWFGYSVGKWVDDTTLVAETTGTNELTWIDRAGRPHSADLRVEERFHRVDSDHLELTVTINDPKMYTKPWVALKDFRFNQQSPHLDIHEMICSPAEFAEYNKLVGDSISEKKGQ
jgi:hypothetical protein